MDGRVWVEEWSVGWGRGGGGALDKGQGVKKKWTRAGAGWSQRGWRGWWARTGQGRSKRTATK